MKLLSPQKAWWFAVLLGACGGFPSRSAIRGRAALNEEHASSTEWLYVTHGVGDRDRECQQAFAHIVAESQCASTACIHGIRLARDWIARCRARASGSRAAEVERLSIIFDNRAGKPPDTCVAWLEHWLRDGCGPNGACQDRAHRWALLCAQPTGSPLAVGLLEKVIERSLGHSRPVKLDARSCSDLVTNLKQAAECADKSACERSLTELELYRQRCRAAERGPARLDEAVATLAILTGAEKAAPSVPVAAEPRTLEPEQARLALVAGRGAVLRLCGKRVVELEQYLEQRRQCVNGELEVALAMDARGQRVVRLGTFDYPGDEAFARRLPWLRVAGEEEHRSRTRLVTLTGALDSIVRRQTELGGLRDFLQAIGPLEPTLLRSDSIVTLLEDRDAALQSMFADLGRRKRRADLSQLTGAARFAFRGRSWSLPLSDVDPEGIVKIGAISPVATLALDQILLKSMAAYRAELGTPGAPGPDPKTEQALSAEVGTRSEACQAALKAADRAERALVDCAFGLVACNPELRQSLGKQLDEARRQAEEARVLTTLAVSALPKAARDTARRGACAP